MHTEINKEKKYDPPVEVTLTLTGDEAFYLYTLQQCASNGNGSVRKRFDAGVHDMMAALSAASPMYRAAKQALWRQERIDCISNRVDNALRIARGA